MRFTAIAALALVWSAPASAAVMLGAEIKGVIYEDGAAPVKVQCKARDGNRIFAEAAGSAVSAAIEFQIAGSCPLRALLGSVHCTVPPLDRDIEVVTVRTKNGTASHLQVLGRQTRNAEEGPVPIILEYTEAFRVDKSSGELAPPLVKVKGRLIVPPRTGEPRFFIGEFKASELPPANPGSPYFSELLCNRPGVVPTETP